MNKVWIAAGALVAAVAFAAPARAQTFLTPLAGATFGKDAPSEKFSTGVLLTFMGDVVGFEVDFGYTPDFFDQQSDFAIVADSNVTSLMGNLLIGAGDGPVRPYGVVGIGLLRTSVDDGGDLFGNVTTNDTAFDVGFGVIGMFSDHVGLRGDIRYFRSLQDPSDDHDFDVSLGNFDFWRATAGLSFRF